MASRRNKVSVGLPLWDAWTCADLNRNELRVLMALVRLSLGAGREDTSGLASYTNLERMTGLVRHRISTGLRGLQQKGLIVLLRRGVARGSSSCYQVITDPAMWSPGTLPTGSTGGTSLFPGDEPSSTRRSATPRLPAEGTSSTGVTSSTGGTSSLDSGDLLEGSDNDNDPPPLGNPKGFPYLPPQSGSLSRVWDVFREFQPGRGSNPPKNWRGPLGSRIKEFGEDGVVNVIRWAHTSSHQRAQFLREKDCLGLTLFRASNFPDYLAFASESKLNGITHEPSPFEQFTDEAWKQMSKTDKDFWSEKLGSKPR